MQMCLPSRQVVGKKSGQDVRVWGIKAEGTNVTHPKGPIPIDLCETERCFAARFVVQSVAAQQPNETENGHATSRILLLGSNLLEPSGDGACSSTRVLLPQARQLVDEGANPRLERRFAGKDRPLRRRTGRSGLVVCSGHKDASGRTFSWMCDN